MAVKTKITLYDIPSLHPTGASSSPFIWRVRIALNYKKLDYQTVWVKIHDIQTFSRDKGFKPTTTNKDGSPKYTFPVIVDETDESKPSVTIADSKDILLYLESKYPDLERPLFPTPGYDDPQSRAPALHFIFGNSLLSVVAPNIRPLFTHDQAKIQFPESLPWLRARVRETTGKELEDIGKDPQELEANWARLKACFNGIASEFESGDQLWLMGSKPTGADIMLLAIFKMIQVVSDSVWGEIKTWNDGRWARYFEAGESYMIIQ